MSDTPSPFFADVVDGRLTLSIGLVDLMRLIEDGPEWDPAQLRITDPAAYALAIGNELAAGETYEPFFLEAIEEAALVATENKCAGVEDVVA